MKILILGTPKSGTTAAFNAVCGAFPNARKMFEPRSLGGFEATYGHLVCKYLRLFHYQGGAKHYDKVIVVVRNRFDFVISALFFAPSIRHGFTDNRQVDRYLRKIAELRAGQADLLNLCDLLSDISGVDQLAYFSDLSARLVEVYQELDPARCLLLRYEDLMAGGRSGELEAFLGRPLAGAEAAIPWMDFIKRTTEVENWPRYLSRRDFDHMNRRFQSFHRRFGYEMETARLQRRDIGRAESEGYVIKVLNRFREENALPPFAPGQPAFAGARQYEEAFSLLQNNEDLEKALLLIEEALRLEPELVGYHRIRADILKALGRLPEAEAAAREGRKRDPDDPSLLALQRDAAALRGQTARVIELQWRLARRFDREAPWRKLILLLLQEERLEEARLLCEDLVARHPRTAGYWHSYASILMRFKEDDGAIEAAATAIDCAPRGAPHWSAYARALAQGGRYSEALLAAQRVAELAPHRALPQPLLALWKRRASEGALPDHSAAS